MADEMREVEKLLESHPSLKITNNKEGKCKVVCELTSHEMPCTLKAIEQYIAGKKYKHDAQNKLTLQEEDLCTQYLVLKRRGQLYCKLTNRHINNVPHHIKLHLKGRRFQKAVQNAQNPNLAEQRTSNKEKEIKQLGKDDTMWSPSGSESESAENDGLGSDFEMDKKDEVAISEDSLDTKSNPTESTSKDKSKLKKTKRKHVKEPTEKEDKLPKDGIKHRKKRKIVQ